MLARAVAGAALGAFLACSPATACAVAGLQAWAAPKPRHGCCPRKSKKPVVKQASSECCASHADEGWQQPSRVTVPAPAVAMAARAFAVPSTPLPSWEPVTLRIAPLVLRI